MKNKTEKKPYALPVTPLIAIITTSALLACLVSVRKQKPAHDTCSKCQHLFAKGSGKAVTVVTVQDADPLAPEAGKPRLFCSEHAPRYDRVFETMNGETVFAYYVKNEPFSMSDSNGDRLDKPKPCGREHVPQADAIVWTNYAYGEISFTNITSDTAAWRWMKRHSTNSNR